jgi:transcription elongation GreA/GreB family factor
MTIKDKLYDYCIHFVDDRIHRIQEEIRSAQAAANEETKSSAGDKYETGRAMAQGTIERNTQQLAEAEKVKAALQRMPAVTHPDRIVPGTLITTSRGMFYLSISIGLVTLEKQTFFIVSADSPIGKSLLGKTIGDVVHWNTMDYSIIRIE